MIDKSVKKKYMPRHYEAPSVSNEHKPCKDISRLMLPSLFGIIICFIALVSVTWAWFSISKTNSGNIIASGTFSATVSVSESGTAVPLTTGSADSYTLLSGKTYIVKLTRSGNINKGYCRVVFGESTYFHQFLDSTAGEFTVTIYPAADSQLKITSVWGNAGVSVTALPATIGTAPVETVAEQSAPQSGEATSSGGDTAGETASGGDTAGGTASGGDTVGGTESGGDTAGGTASGGDTAGETASGGDTTSGGDTAGSTTPEGSTGE